MSNPPKQFFGKYRGTVTNTFDPKGLGRIQVTVPGVLGLLPSSWALPCFPVTGKQYGIVAIPQVGTGVWVEFEKGDPTLPIWSGCWYGVTPEVPASALLVPTGVPGIVLQTTSQNTLIVSDVPGPTGGILIRTAGGALVSINDALGITISNGKGASISMQGSSVFINRNALVLT